MPAPKKNSKVILHEGFNYRWTLENRRGVNQLIVELNESIRGQKLIADLPKIVSHQMITEGIDFALAHGWDPRIETAGPFTCLYGKRTFTVTEA